MKDFLKAWLTYSRPERNGIIVLSLLLALVIAFRLLWPVFIKPKPITVDPSAFQKEIAVFEKDTLLDLNTATAEQLRYIKGVGPAISQRIIDYRDALGGFTKVEQVNEIKGIGDAKYAIISPHLKVDSANLNLNKIALNTATEEQLKAHPYIDQNLALLILKQRPFQSIDEVKKLMSEEQFERLEPYLELK